MSYKNSENFYGGNASNTGWLVASDAYYSDPDPNCKVYHLNNNGKLTDTDVRSGGDVRAMQTNGYAENIRVSNGGLLWLRGPNASGSDIYISQGGAIYVQSGAKITNLEILDGGTVNQYQGTYTNMIVHAGGRAVMGGYNQTPIIYNGLTVETGATFTTYPGFIMMGNITIAQGTWTNDADAYALNGNICHLNLADNAQFRDGITLSNYTQTAGTVSISSGAAVDNGTITGGVLNVSAGATVDTITQNGGTLNAEAGTVKNLTYNAGTLTVAAGVTVENFNQTANTVSFVNGVILKDATLGGGTLNIANGVTVNGLTYNAGTLNLSSGVTVNRFTYNGAGTLDIKSGATIDGGTINGNLNFRKGATGNNITITTGQVQYDPQGNTTGTDNVYGENIRMTGGTLFVKWAGTVVSNVQVSGGILYGRSGGIVRDVDVYSGGQIYVRYQDSATFSGATVHSSGVVSQFADMRTEFADLTVEAGGKVYLNNFFTLKGDVDIAEGAEIYLNGTRDADVTAENGTIYNLNNKLTGFFASGITLSNYTQTAGEVQLTAGAAAKTAALTGGTLRVLSGATGDGITVSAGNMYVSDGGRIDNIVVHSGGNLHLSTGAQVFGLAVSGNTANGLLNMYAGGYVSGATVSANKGDANIVYMYGGGLMEDVTFEKAGIFLSSGGTLRNVTQRDGAYVILRGENPYVSGARVSGGTLFFQNGAKGKNIVIVGGNMQVQDGGATNVPGSGAYVSSMDLVTGTINVSAGGRIDDLRASGGTVNITSTNGNYGKGATLSGAVFTGGTLNITGNALVEAADIGEDAAVTITGGNLYVRNYGWNITQTGGTVHVAADATVTGVTQTAGSLDIGVGATVKNYEKNGTEAVRLANNATVDGGVMYAGQLNARVLDSVANATVKNYTMRGNNATYLIVQGAGNSAENIAVSGGSLCIQAYATARNIDVYAGGVINTPSHQPGSYIYGLNIHDGGSGDFTATNSNKRLEIYDLNMEDGATLALRLARVSRGTISGGTIKVDNALFYDVTMSGGQIFASGGVIFDKGVGMNVSQTTGQLIVRSGAAVYNVDISGNELYIQNGSIISGAIVRDGAIFYTQSGTVYDLTLKAGASVNSQSWGMGAVTLDGIDVETGATLTLFDNITLRGDIDIAVGTVAGDADAYAEDGTIRNLDISGSVLNVQSGITLDHLNIGRAGRIVATDAAITNFDIEAPDQTAVGRLYLSSGAVASGGRLNGTGTVNAIYMTDGAKLNEMHVSDGGIFLSANAELTNLEMTGGIVILRGEQTYISGATVAEGALHIQNGGDGDDITVAGGSLSVTDTTHTNPMGKNEIVNDVAITAGAITVGSGGTINRLAATGGTINVSSAGTLNSVTVGNKATLNVSGGTANSTTVNLQGGMYVYSGGTANSTTVNAMGGMHVSGGVANSTIVNSYGNMHVRSGGTVNEATVNSSGTLYVSSGVANSTTVNSRGNMNISSGGVANAITVNSGNLYVFESGVANSTTANGGNLYLFSGGTINGLTATSGTVNVFSGGTINNAAVTNTLNDLQVFEGATVNYKENKGVALLQGSNTNIAASTFHYNGAAEANGFSVENGVVKNLGEDGKAYRLTVGDGIVVENATINSGWRISAVATAVVSGGLAYGSGAEGVVVMRDSSYAVGMTLSGVGGSAQSGLLNLWDNASAAEIIVSNGGVLRMNDSRNAVSGTTVLSGGTLFFINSGSVNANGATMEDTTIKAGGRLMLQNITTLNTGDLLTIDFTGTTGNQSVAIDDLSLINASTTIMLVGETAPETGSNTYTIATTGSTDKYVNCGDWGLYDDTIKAGETITNAFTSMTYAFNATGTAIEVTAFEAAAQSEAGSIEGGTTLADGGKAAKWTANTTTTSGSVIKAATSAITGGAWLEIDGTNLTDTTLYGAETGFTGGVNLYALNDAVVNNLAAGAEAGGTVESVKLTIEDATVGLAYAGGFGNVTSKTETLISGATLQKDFYAGALANYAKTGTVTHTGDITLEIADGEFSGNIYGAASVKAGAATSLVHSVGNVTITVKDGETKKGNQACLFAGGYATGSAASDSAVYTVGNVDVTISGGTWTSGATAGGRGVFGGIFASQVTAVAEDVTLTITGGTFGNVYGGGWAQKNGVSVVDDVEITIDGGTIANVFGGGTHSTSGGSTIVDDVSINISGGNITGAIYARGQLDGDVVSGDEVNVTFTGDTNFGCGVFGYSYVGGAASDAVLSYTAYTGTFSGAIGGFDSIVFDDDTAMTLSTAAADVSNGKWEFDFTDRAAELAGTSFLTWSGADFAGDAIKVSFTDETQAKAGWNIAAVAEAFSGTTFNVEVGGSEIATGLAYNQQIASGDYAGWGFDLESGVLKFKQLA